MVFVLTSAIRGGFTAFVTKTSVSMAQWTPHTLKLIGEGATALFMGKLGTGKSHLAKAVGYRGTLQGYNERYQEA